MERRTSPRLRSLLGGQIVFNGRCSTMDCVIRNISPTGARITFTNTVTVPDEFDLVIRKRQETIRARMVWRRADEIGVRFMSPETQANVVSLDTARRLRSLEAERAVLQRRVRELSSAD